MNRDEKIHVEWLSLVQQDGLLVSAMTLAEKEIYIRQPIEKQQAFREKTEEAGLASFEDLRVLLEWTRNSLREPKEEEILHFLDLFATIKPTWILQSLKREPMIAVFWCEEGLDESPKDQKWVATHQVRVE
ncbi:MAG: hypothetical protein CL916_05060, partial [Deltaproteobacteria bacterium]|nr:hypothetical protein [Deltaproteobacteria bacterium]